MTRRVACVLLFGLAALPAAGCGSRYAQVSGAVVEDGQPFAASADWVEVVFLCDEPSIRYSVSVKKDGTFVAYGPNGDGIPAGKYRVGIFSEVDGKRKKRLKDLVAEQSPLELDLSAGGKVNITVDLVKQTLKTG